MDLTEAYHGELRIVSAASLLAVALAAALLLVAGTGVDGTELALRMTARLSLVYFLLAFVARPLDELQPTGIGRWLCERRRAFGVAFAVSMSLHVAFIVRLYVLHSPARPPMVTDTDLFIGIPALLMVVAMTLSSVLVWRNRMGERWWKRLQTTGLYLVWSVFFLCLVDSVSRKTTLHPVLAYQVFIAALVGAMALRVAAALQARRAR